MRYQVDNEIFDNIDDAIEYCIVEDYHEDDDYFEEWVNEAYGSISINGESYWAYDILEQADDYNFRELKSNFCESQNERDIDDARYELRDAEVGTFAYLHGSKIEVIEDSDDFDGDSNLEEIRKSIEAQKAIDEQIATENKKAEDDLMSMFQVIS